jgi:hypothetical protein
LRSMSDARIVLRKELASTRALGFSLFPALCGPLFILLAQIVCVALMVFLARRIPEATSLLAIGLGRSVTTILGAAMILMTGLGLGNTLNGRERFTGELEGILATPVSTSGLWIGKTFAFWLSGALAFVLSLAAAEIGFGLLPPEIPAAPPGGPMRCALESALLLLTSLGLIALSNLIALGASRRVAGLASILPMVILGAAGLGQLYFMAKGEAERLGTGSFVLTELVALPIIFCAIALLAPRMLERERIVSKML